MTFHASLSLVVFNDSVTRTTSNHFVSTSNTFSCWFPFCVFPGPFQLSQDVLVSLFSSHGQKRLFGAFLYSFYESSCCSVLVILFRFFFYFFAVHEIRSIFRRNYISVVSSFFCTCFEIVQAWHPCIKMDSI